MAKLYWHILGEKLTDDSPHPGLLEPLIDWHDPIELTRGLHASKTFLAAYKTRPGKPFAVCLVHLGRIYKEFDNILISNERTIVKWVPYKNFITALAHSYTPDSEKAARSLMKAFPRFGRAVETRTLFTHYDYFWRLEGAKKGADFVHTYLINPHIQPERKLEFVDVDVSKPLEEDMHIFGGEIRVNFSATKREIMKIVRKRSKYLPWPTDLNEIAKMDYYIIRELRRQK